MRPSSIPANRPTPTSAAIPVVDSNGGDDDSIHLGSIESESAVSTEPEERERVEEREGSAAIPVVDSDGGNDDPIHPGPTESEAANILLLLDAAGGGNQRSEEEGVEVLMPLDPRERVAKGEEKERKKGASAE